MLSQLVWQQNGSAAQSFAAHGSHEGESGSPAEQAA
jgi:hypothetical protein